MKEEKFIKRCFELAQQGCGNVSPNPLVGCTIVFDDKIIGEGWHKKYGEAHAEVNAINSVKDKALLQSSTLYVNLEPCSHYGKTPPCADLIIKHKIPKVVISNIDPNPKVSGNGIKKLRDAGIDVTTGILEKEGEHLNRKFFSSILKQRPYIILKWAETKDGFIDKIRENNKREVNWITSEKLKPLVHKWRSENDAIMVGRNTINVDNPFLNVRLWHGKSPIRISLSRKNEINANSNILDNTIPTYIFTEENNKHLNKKNLNYLQIEFNDNVLQNILSELHKLKIQSLFVEGGTDLLNSFIEHNLWDEAKVFIGNKYYEKGVIAPRLNTHNKATTEKYANDYLISIYNI